MRLVLAVIITGAAGGLITAPWYLKNLVLTGNPLWPFAYTVFGGEFLTPGVNETLKRELSAFGDEKSVFAFIKFPVKFFFQFSPLFAAGLIPVVFAKPISAE